MNETDLENELRALRPAKPSSGLERRIAHSLDAQVEPPARLKPGRSAFAWWLERLLWAFGGAATAAVVAVTTHHPSAVSSPPMVVQQKASPAADNHVSEQLLAWTDEGVQFIDKVPARLLRRVTLERHLSEDGSVEVQVPREDVIVMPVALR